MKRRIKKSHFENINALRFIAFFCIFFSFAVIIDNPNIANVSFYKDLVKFSINLKTASTSLIFILTGFLNAHAIFEERFVYKQINVLRLYMRRLLAVIPLFLAVFLVGYFALPNWNMGVEGQAVSETSKISYIAFLQNYSMDAEHYMKKSTWNLVGWQIDNFWLIAAQIQAIIILPLLMSFFRRLENVFIILFIALSIGFGFIWGNNSSASFNLLFHFSDIALGVLIAYVSFFKYKLYYKLKSITRRNMGLFYVAIILWVVLSDKIISLELGVSESIKLTLSKLVIGCLMAYVVFEQHFCSTSLIKLSKLKPLNWIGDYSLGLFAWFPLAILLAEISIGFIFDSESSLSSFLLAKLSLSFTYSVILALLSDEFIEKRFHRLRKNYQPIKDLTPSSLKDDAQKPA